MIRFEHVGIGDTFRPFSDKNLFYVKIGPNSALSLTNNLVLCSFNKGSNVVLTNTNIKVSSSDDKE